VSTPIDVDRVRELLDRGAQLVEVLPAAEYRDEHLPGAINLPLKRLDGPTADAALNRRRAVIVYCWDSL
jgi:rhodanese-related sulfurtransferase